MSSAAPDDYGVDRWTGSGRDRGGRERRPRERLGVTDAADRSAAEGEQMPDDVRWFRSYVLAEPDGSVGTVCIYQASSADAIREHAGRADLPVDERPVAASAGCPTTPPAIVRTTAGACPAAIRSSSTAPRPRSSSSTT